MTGHALHCRLPLPEGFRMADVLAFHRRDPQQLAERTFESDAGTGLDKGVVWKGRPARLEIRINGAELRARCVIDGVDGANAGDADAQDALAGLVRHMLGLDQPVEAFERAHAGHPQLGPLLARNAGLRVPQAATPFEALSWAIVGQQVSLGAAVALRRKLILAVGRQHSSGLMCYPDASSLLQLDAGALRAAGCSQTKAEALLTLARAEVEGELPLEDWMGRGLQGDASSALPVDEIRARLLAIRGIGPWTVNYALLRGFGWLDGSLHGDAAVRRGLQHLIGSSERIGEREAERWLAPFSPWRALVAAHLWTLKVGD